MSDEPSTTTPAWPALRPQSVLLTFFGDYVADAGVLVAATGLVTVLAGVGIGEAAARATLSRMVRRELLHREVRGRRAFFGLTDHGRRTVLDGRARTRQAALGDVGWDGTWTVVAFSMPETWQRQRHDLRSRLRWAGFGGLQGGLWVAPRRVDVVATLEGLGVEPYVRVLHATPADPTQAADLIRDGYDLAALAERYAAFTRRWAPCEDAADPPADVLSRRTVLTTDWLQAVRDDPRLPLPFLPQDWPAVPAAALFRRLSETWRADAEAAVHRLVEVLPDP